jgi:hypothetical protein
MGEVFERLLARMGAKAFSEYGVIGIVSVLVAYLVLLSLSRFVGYAFNRKEEFWGWLGAVGSVWRNANRQLKSEIVLSVVCAVVLLIAAISEWPYFMYVLLRLFVCCSSAHIANGLYRQHRIALTWVAGAIALLYNPVLPVRMARSDWGVVNALLQQQPSYVPRRSAQRR